MGRTTKDTELVMPYGDTLEGGNSPKIALLMSVKTLMVKVRERLHMRHSIIRKLKSNVR